MIKIKGGERMLKFSHFVKSIETRYPDDRRIKCTMTIAEYRDKEGDIYRKAFYTKNGCKPIMPRQATHDELIALKKQF